MKKLSASFTLLALFLCSLSNAEPLYWKAVKGDKELMLLGSVHMGKPEMYPLPETITDFLDSSDALVLELDLSSGESPDIEITVKESTSQYLTEEQKRKLSVIAKEVGLSESVLLKQPIWYTALTLQSAYLSRLGFQEKLGIDRYISKEAMQRKIPQKGLESINFQFGLFAGSKGISRALLDDAVNNWDRNKAFGQCLKENWLSGDKDNILAFAEPDDEDEAISDVFIYSRNKNWAEQLDNNDFLPAKGRYLVVVGTLHLIGEKNLITLLEKKGFSVQQLSRSEPSQCVHD